MFQRNLLTDAATEQLADAVLTILEKVGVFCQNEEMLRALDDWGAQVDYANETAKFPRSLVDAFAAELRQERHKDDSGHCTFVAPSLRGLGTQVAQFFYDDRARGRRSGSREDLITLIKLGEVLHGDQGVGHSLLLRDVPPLLEPLEAGLLLAEYASKPGPPFAWDARQVDYLIEMGEILGIKDWFTMGAVCFSHPLRFDKDVADRFVRMVKLGIPAGLTGMQVAGATTPVTIAGFVAVSAAEFVATWIAGRALNPRVRLGGAMFAGDVRVEPLGGIIWAGTVDMRSGEVSYSAPDAMLRAFAVSEFLGRWCGYRIPIGGGEYASAKVPGLYAALEKAYKAMTIAAFTGRHPQTGEGMVDTGKTISPVQLLLDREMGIALQSLGQPVEVTPETIAMDTILEVGFGLESNYLVSEHTLRHYRDSLWLPQLISRTGWNGFAEEEALLEKARAKVESLIATYRKPEADPGKLARLRQVVERARRELL
ncbi:MAG: trimethylamine methyltransferase family protein [Anaerolineae bacterium]